MILDYFDEALNARLTGDAALVALVGVYQAAPAIFFEPEVPENAPRPYVWVQQPDSDNSWDSKTHQGREIVRSLVCVADNDGTWNTPKAIANRVREILHRKPVVQGDSSGTFLGRIAEISGPVQMPADKSLAVMGLTLVHRHSNSI